MIICKECIHYDKCVELEVEFIGKFQEIECCFDSKDNYVKVKHGKWVRNRAYVKCTNCGKNIRDAWQCASAMTYDYCPHCGARMDSEEGD